MRCCERQVDGALLPWDTTCCLPELLGTVVHVARCASSWTTATMIITQIASKHDPSISSGLLDYYNASHESWVSFDMHKMYPLERHEQSKEFLWCLGRSCGDLGSADRHHRLIQRSSVARVGVEEHMLAIAKDVRAAGC